MVIWSKTAKIDLRSIHDHIAHDSKFYAKKVIGDITAKTDVLDELPRMGRMVPETNNENIREFPMYSYRILYEIKDQDIFVLAVIHKRQQLQQEVLA